MESNYRIRSWKLQDPPIREVYEVRVSKKLDSSESGNENIEVCWQNLKDCMKEAAMVRYVVKRKEALPKSATNGGMMKCKKL